MCTHNSTLGVANCVVDAKAECNAYSASVIENQWTIMCASL